MREVKEVESNSSTMVSGGAWNCIETNADHDTILETLILLPFYSCGSVLKSYKKIHQIGGNCI